MKSEEDKDAAVKLVDENVGRLASLRRVIADKSGTRQLDAIDRVQGDLSSRIGFLSDERNVMYKLLMIKMQRRNSKGFLVLLAAMAVVCLGAGAFSLLLVRRLLGPLASVTSTLKGISEGEGDLARRLEVRSEDEIGSLAGAFNSFADSLGRIVDAIRGSTRRLSGLGDSLADGMSETSSAVEIAANVGSIERAVPGQAAGVEETQATAASIAGMVDKLSGSFQKLLAVSDEGRAKLADVNDASGPSRSSRRASSRRIR